MISALACVGQLALIVVAVLRGGRSPLTLPLALLCVDLLTWNAADLFFQLTPHPGWRLVDLSASPLTTPLALDFVLTFVGQRRRFGWLRLLCYGAFGLLSLASVLAFVWPAARAFAGSHLWAALHLAGALPAMAFAGALLFAHLRATTEEERSRTRLLLAAIVVAALLGSTDLWGHFFPAVPGLAPVGMLAGSTLMTVAAMRLHLFEGKPSAGILAAALAVAGVGVLAYFALFRLVVADTALLVFGIAIVSLLLMAATRELTATSARVRARRSQLALLGRYSAQLGHDLKNPLAALKGAAQFLEEQLARDGAPRERGEFVKLILEQVGRLQTTLDRYQRLSQAQLARSPVALNEVVQQVIALQPFAAAGPVSLRADLAADVPVCSLDRELLATALENLLANAFEAMPQGGHVIVRTAAGKSELVLSVEDDGPGMDARTRERAFDELFTTKASGSGLGLPFVRRVAEAHGGSVSLIPREPRGTVVEVRLPLE